MQIHKPADNSKIPYLCLSKSFNMKSSLRIFLSIVFICSLSTINSFGKGYTIPVHSRTITKFDTSETIVAILLKNNDTLPGNQIDTFKWAFISNSFAFSGWSYNFCDFASCYTPPNLPNGATDLLSPTDNGSFTLTVSSFNNLAISASMSIKVWDPKDVNNPDTITITINAAKMGIENNLLPSSFADVFPNPATDHINLKTSQPGFEPVNAVIYNTLGKTVSEQSISGGTTTLPVYDLPKGIYILRLHDQYGREAMKQFVKE